MGGFCKRSHRKVPQISHFRLARPLPRVTVIRHRPKGTSHRPRGTKVCRLPRTAHLVLAILLVDVRHPTTQPVGAMAVLPPLQPAHLPLHRSSWNAIPVVLAVRSQWTNPA